MAAPFKWMTENLGLKLVALLLAIGFWFYVAGEESIEMTRTVPLKISTANEKVRLVKSSTKFLEVTLQAPRHLLQLLSSADIRAVHEIEEAQQAGDYSFHVNVKDFSLPAPEIRISKIFPTFVTATLDEVIVKKLPIHVRLMGTPAFGYRVDESAIELDPNAVLVEGPKAILEKMDAIDTEPVQLVGRIRSFKRTVMIPELPDVKPLGDRKTEAHIPVKAEYAEKELEDVLVKPLGIPSSGHYVRLETDRTSIVLKGPRAVLEKLQLQDILAFVEVDGLKAGNHQVPLKLILPPDLALKEEAPLISIQVNKLKR